MRGKLIGVLFALFALFGCVNARPVSMEVREDEYLKWVHDDRWGLTLMETVSTDKELLDIAHAACAEIARTGGTTPVFPRPPPGLSEAEFQLLTNDQGVILAGAVTFICPETG